MSWLNKMTLLTHFFYWWKGYVFVVPKIIFFGCTSRYLVYRYVVAQLCGCRIVQLDLVAKSLPFSISLNNCYYELLCIHSPSLPFFFFFIRFDDFSHLYHQCFFWGILYTNHTLNENQIVGRSIIKTGISQRGELWFNIVQF